MLEVFAIARIAYKSTNFNSKLKCLDQLKSQNLKKAHAFFGVQNMPNYTGVAGVC
jgi:hypothetical protein